MAIQLTFLNSFSSTSPDAIEFDPISGNIFSVESFRTNPESGENPEDFSLNLVEYDTEGNLVNSLNTLDDVLVSGVGLAGLPNGNFLISDVRVDNRLVEIDTSGNIVDGGIDLLSDPLDGGNIFVGITYDETNDSIFGVDSFTGQLLEIDTELGSDGNLNILSEIDLSLIVDNIAPSGLAIDPTTGNFIVADDSDGNDAIHEITRDGELVTTIEIEALTGFADPEGLALSDGNLYVAFDNDSATGVPFDNGNQIAVFELTNSDSLFDTDIFRFQSNEIPGSYLFAGGDEAQSIRDNFADSFTEEGFAFTVASQPGDDLDPLYRFRSSQGTYLLVGEEERAAINSDPSFSGEYTEEGLAFYVYGSDSDEGSDFNRLRNLNIPGAYLYATGDELATIQTNFADTYFDEGAAFEAFV